MSSRTVKVDYLARVEGEGALYIQTQADQVEEVQLQIFEPPRFFESLLRGRDFTEAPDITARVCGICPVAYLMSACHAMEDACGVTVEGPLRDLRRLLYCGEWIESHILHIFMLHTPDFLGYPDATTMAKDYPDRVKQALHLKKLGNGLISLLGGREIHPINVRVGGFYNVPRKRELEAQVDDLKHGLEAAQEVVRFVAGLPFPDFERDYEFVALNHSSEYPFNEGRLTSTQGIDTAISAYDQVLVEHQVPYSTALQTRIQGRGPVHMGPMARYALNRDKLTPVAKQLADEVGLESVCRNPYKSIIVRAIEVVFAFEEAIRLITAYEEPKAPAIEVRPRAGTGYGGSEAPRGLLYHRYSIAADGTIQDAKLVPPTAVNQGTIEQDLYRYVAPNITLSDEELKSGCERVIRNYDPCISCSAHFLDLEIDRE